MYEEKEWYEEISPERLPETYKHIVAAIGLKATIQLAQKFQGTPLYLPKLDDTLREIRDEKIRKEFNGSNYGELAVKYKLTEVWIREIIDKRPAESNQISLFEVQG